ncbi:acyl carrier protein [Fundicoccus sp. Sow4_H7]|uniref:acyl carrier protein n=1 Tax=Fundicoccus sp. Sow4_H7 TaxID=3438784 RepID=UPI003F8EDBA6
MTANNETFEIVQKMIVERFGVQEEKVTEKMTFDDLGVDSLDVVELVMELENRFGVQFEDEKIEELNSIEDAVQYIEQLRD